MVRGTLMEIGIGKKNFKYKKKAVRVPYLYRGLCYG
jgi:hypothetical protein